MTQAEYEKKYGQTPTVSPTPTPTPSQGMGSQISNAFQSGVQQVKTGFDQAQLGNNPAKAFQGATNIASGAINAATAPLAPVFAPIGKLVNYAADKISDNPSVQNFAQSKAGQITSDIAETTGNLSNIAGTVASFSGAGSAVKNVAEKTGETVKPAIQGTGRVLKSAGEGTYGITVPPTEATAKSLMSYDAKQPNLAGRVKNMLTGESNGVKPITEANTAARKGLVGTEYQIGVQAKKVSQDLWENTISPKLDAVKGSVNMKNFFDEVEKAIVKDTKELSRRNSLKEALGALRENYQKVGNVNLKKLHEYKKGFAEFLPDSTYKGKPIGAALKEVQNIAAQKAREIIYKNVGEEGKQAFLDYGNLQSIIESGAKSITGDAAKKSLGKNIWQAVMDNAVTPVATLAGKVLYKTGEGLELVGKSGAKKVKDIIDK